MVEDVTATAGPCDGADDGCRLGCSSGKCGGHGGHGSSAVDTGDECDCACTIPGKAAPPDVAAAAVADCEGGRGGRAGEERGGRAPDEAEGERAGLWTASVESDAACAATACMAAAARIRARLVR